MISNFVFHNAMNISKHRRRSIQPLATLVLSVAALAMLWPASKAFAGKYNPVLDYGSKAPAWKDLPGVDGKKHSLDDLKKSDVVVVVFTCNSCDYAVEYEDRIIAFAKKYSAADSGVSVVAINVNRIEEDSLPAMKKRAAKRKFPFMYLFDESQKIANDYGAIRTPEFFVLDKNRKIAYMGAFDDSTDASKVKKVYVEDAIAAVKSGKKPKVEETVAIGCRIRFERRRRKRR